MSIVVLLVLLLGLIGWFGSVGDGLSVQPTVPVASIMRQEPEAAEGASQAVGVSLAPEAADCTRARGIQARLRDAIGRSLSFFLATQDTLMGDLDRWPDQLEGSTDPEALYVAGGGFGHRPDHMAPSERIERLGKALAVDTTNPMYLSSLLNLCTQHPSLPDCDLPDAERRLAEFDGDNGLSWALIGMSCAKREEAPCVVEAMERAAQAPAFRDYYIDRALLMERVMGAAGISFPMRSVAGFGFALEDLPSPVRVIEACRMIESPRLDHACFGFGQRLEVEGGTMWTQSLGRAVLAVAAKRLGDEQAVEAVRARGKRANDERLALHGDSSLAATNDVFTARLLWDRDFFLDFMSHMRQVGEHQAYVDGARGWGTGPSECLTPMELLRPDDT
ncbi:MAG: hypothetical protein AAGA68_10865 [Pseudomonadota bacterium]